MKVIFLDIDGVLNHSRTPERFEGMLGIDRILLARFKKVVRITGANVVLSSPWRKWTTGIAHIEEQGIPLIGHTPWFASTDSEDLKTGRGQEIRKWLSLHPEVTEYAIVDDDSDMLPGQPLFQTHYTKGLTAKVASNIIKHFAHHHGTSEPLGPRALPAAATRSD